MDTIHVPPAPAPAPAPAPSRASTTIITSAEKAAEPASASRPSTTIIPPAGKSAEPAAEPAPGAPGPGAPGAESAPPPEPPPMPPPLPPAPPAPPPRRPPAVATAGFWRQVWHGCLVSSFALVAGTILLLLLLSRGCSQLAAGIERGRASDPFAKTGVESLNLGSEASEEDAPRVLYVRLRGEISSESGVSSAWGPDPGSAPAALRAIRRATLDPEIDAILLDVDSPGGDVTASDVLWDALQAFRASRQDTATPRFVVALFGATAASGAYYAAAAADCIVAHPTTFTGSIGVKIESINIRKLANDNGVQAVSITSGKNKNMLSPMEDLTQEQRAMLQKQVDAMHARFVEIVAKGRRLSEDRVRALADGRILLAPEAKEAGLVDEIGYLDDARAEVRKRLGGRMPLYVRYEEEGELLRSLISPSYVGSVLREAIPSAGLPALLGTPAPRAE